MRPAITKLKLQNFKKFKTFDIEFDEKLNVLVGDNEAGKSSILTAIDLAMSGSHSKVESLGIENLLNHEAVESFLGSARTYEELPEMFIELYLNEQQEPDLNGSVNSERKICDGLLLWCHPNDDLSTEIRDLLSQDELIFPFEFYKIEFKTFAGQPFSPYKRFLKHLFVDNSAVNTEYAIKEYIKDIYLSKVDGLAERVKHQSEYRKHKEIFKTKALAALNMRLEDYEFAVKTGARANLETDLTILEEDIVIDNRGRGRQVFIKTDFALRKDEGDLDLVLIEEPENHLSHINTQKLIDRICASDDKQIILSTHDDRISARLDLRKCALIYQSKQQPLKLAGLTKDTAEFFIKAPDNNILELILAQKAVLIEGDAEYILIEDFYKRVLGHKPERDGVAVIALGGTSFKRYLEVAKLLGIKVAAIRDNDGNYQANCIDNYEDYCSGNVKIFADEDNARSTFEIAVYEDNKAVCDSLFGSARRTLTVQEYMLSNKADAAFSLLEHNSPNLKVPDYIESAIKWIKD